jgi:RNA-directed DNA polymerase
MVFRLQRRIYKASREDNFRKVKKLQRLLLKSRSAKFLAVRQVTQLNTGKRTPGIDGIACLGDIERLQLVEELHRNSRIGIIERLEEYSFRKRMKRNVL